MIEILSFVKNVQKMRAYQESINRDCDECFKLQSLVDNQIETILKNPRQFIEDNQVSYFIPSEK